MKINIDEVIVRHKVSILGNLNAEKTLIFVHGFGSEQSAWRYILPVFEKQYRIILFDLIGSGFLSVDNFDIKHYQNFNDYARDLIEICNLLKLEKVTLIAHSASCMIATLVALREPDFFEKMIFISASPRYLNDKNYVGGFSENEAVKMLEVMVDNYSNWIYHYSTKAINSPQKAFLSEEFGQCLLKLNPDIALVVFKMIIFSDHRHQVSKLQLPTLIIQPRDDIFVPLEVGIYLSEVIENSSFKILSAKGHFPQLTHPDILAETISKYLNNILG